MVVCRHHRVCCVLMETVMTAAQEAKKMEKVGSEVAVGAKVLEENNERDGRWIQRICVVIRTESMMDGSY